MFRPPVRPGDSAVNRVGELPAVTRADGLLFKRMGGAVFPASACRLSAENCPDRSRRPWPAGPRTTRGPPGNGWRPFLSGSPRRVPILVNSQRIIVGSDLVSMSPAPDAAVGIRPGGDVPVSVQNNLPPSISCLPADLVPLNLGGADDFPVQDHHRHWRRVPVRLWLLQVSASFI